MNIYIYEIEFSEFRTKVKIFAESRKMALTLLNELIRDCESTYYRELGTQPINTIIDISTIDD